MIIDAMFAQALGENLKLRTLQPRQVFAQSLADVGANQRLIAAEAERRSNLF